MDLYLNLAMLGKSKMRNVALSYTWYGRQAVIYTTPWLLVKKKKSWMCCLQNLRQIVNWNTTSPWRGIVLICIRKRQTIDQYVTELKLTAANCSYGELEGQMIQDCIVCGKNLEVIKQHLLCAEALTLDKAISICSSQRNMLNYSRKRLAVRQCIAYTSKLKRIRMSQQVIQSQSTQHPMKINQLATVIGINVE